MYQQRNLMRNSLKDVILAKETVNTDM